MSLIFLYDLCWWLEIFFQFYKVEYDGNVIVIDGSLIFVTTMDIIDTIRNDIIILWHEHNFSILNLVIDIYYIIIYHWGFLYAFFDNTFN